MLEKYFFNVFEFLEKKIHAYCSFLVLFGLKILNGVTLKTSNWNGLEKET